MEKFTEFKMKSKFSKKTNEGLLVLVSFITVLFLFYIDEGYYNFYWAKSFGNWVIFGLYLTIILTFYILLSKLLSFIKFGLKRTIITVLLGTFAILSFVLMYFSK